VTLTLTLELEVTALVVDAGLRAPYVYQVKFPIGRYYALPVSALVGLVTLTLNLGRIIALGLDFFLPILDFLGRFVLDIGQHLPTSRDLETMTFDLEDHGACR